ncbi:MAG: class I SAM-dependent methyltransferase, partial [Syntrophaceae bacterium]
MDEGRASRTAIATAYFRAHHYAHASPKIFEDSLAGALLSAREREAVEKFLLEGLAKFNPGLARSGADRTTLLGHALAGLVVVLARARYTEDRLAEAMRDGVSQYVVIGAGLDTFALRRPDLQDRLRVIEID